MGPAVNCSGSWLTLWKGSPFSRRAQISLRPLRTAWKRKYFPSGVQLPLAEFAAPRHPSSIAWGLLPSAPTCHSEFKVELLTEKRTTRPSGESASNTEDRREWRISEGYHHP